jgi:hypothetical protein
MPHVSVASITTAELDHRHTGEDGRTTIER